MRKLLTLFAVAVLSIATCVAANPIKGPYGPLIPSPAPERYYEFICDTTPGLLSIYIVYSWPHDATAVEFSAPKPDCFAAQYVSDTQPFPVTIGNSQAGVSIGFGSCRQPPVHVLTITYFAFGTTPEDCFYPTLPHPYTGKISVVDCQENVVSLSGGGNFINPPEAACWATPVEASTWGKVKLLFSD